MAADWAQAEADRFPGELGERIYSSRLLGRDGTLVLHGGGNTSVKLSHTDLYGAEQELLYVKCSGQDLANIDAGGFTGLRLAQLRALTELDGASDADAARELRRAAIDPDLPPPSVEALLHAILPHRYVDHTHAQAVRALTNTPSGQRHVRAAYADSAIVVPYTRPGHGLARLCLGLINAEMRDETIGLVLMNHGLVSFGQNARESYERMLELVARAQHYHAGHARTVDRPQSGEAAEPDRPAAIGLKLARLRAELSRVAGIPLTVHRDSDPASLAFARRSDVDRLSQSGPATPDHVLWTKRVPMLGTDVERYAAAYRAYFEQNRRTEEAAAPVQMLDPAPRVVLDRELGLCTAGRDAAEARKAADLYRHTIDLILDAEALERYQALPASEIFAVEYWPAEQAKLWRQRGAEFSGQTVLVTGAASGIGAACVDAFLARGASVCGLDVSDAVDGVADGPSYLGLVCDVTDQAGLAAAIEQCALAFGGLDMLVPSAGIFPASQRIEGLGDEGWRRTFAVNTDANLTLLRLAHPFLALAPGGGRVVIVASKNVPAPGPGAAAYSASKAALTQLARVAALEWGEDRIRVNVLHPNAVFDTGIWTDEVINARAAQYGLTAQEYRTNNVLRTEITSADVAELACAMCGAAFAKTTGAQVPVDGGNERVI